MMPLPGSPPASPHSSEAVVVEVVLPSSPSIKQQLPGSAPSPSSKPPRLPKQPLQLNEATLLKPVLLFALVMIVGSFFVGILAEQGGAMIAGFRLTDETWVGGFVSRVQEYGRFGPNPTLHRIVRIFESV